ncbi:hypothetical protein P7K49_019698 [Saguinus oedipus]|uniref:DAGKc domain-containing protein n=1 Tax=Saguinus oedipus TaxID=9490 RepID=A0ABQ9UYF7_SAGOE|nr:hypothetical protein P7K49_019698 [Saguinus oedipus]
MKALPCEVSTYAKSRKDIGIHDDCLQAVGQECDCGLLRDHILPPSSIYPSVLATGSDRKNSKTSQKTMDDLSTSEALRIDPVPNTHPLLVFVNPKSGGKQGQRLRLFKDVPDSRILVCGGDGTVGWILETIERGLGKKRGTDKTGGYKSGMSKKKRALEESGTTI